MLQTLAARIFSLALLCTVCSAALAQEFSADVFNTNTKDAVNAGKLYAKGSKIRVDGAGASAGAPAARVIVDLEKNSVIIVDATNHAYMKSEIDAEANLSFFHLADANNACPELNKMAGMQNSCKKSGDESVNGRRTVKYSGELEDGKPVEIWVDPQVNFVVKWLKGDEAGELRNIKVGPQAASLFEVPADYHNALKESGKDASQKEEDKKEPSPQQ
jgi:hypothetical protein